MWTHAAGDGTQRQTGSHVVVVWLVLADKSEESRESLKKFRKKLLNVNVKRVKGSRRKHAESLQNKRPKSYLTTVKYNFCLFILRFIVFERLMYMWDYNT